ncbi:MAG: sortase [Candidatus Saccharimonadales bacterium]
MNNNPLFPSDNKRDDNAAAPAGHRLVSHVSKPIVPPKRRGQDQASAVSFMRQKVANLYADEPSAKAEIQEVEAIKPQSKHQKFMAELNNSGQSLADIQVAWHNYYAALPENEKHQVWTEFYESNYQSRHAQVAARPPAAPPNEAKPSDDKPTNQAVVGSDYATDYALTKPNKANRNRRRQPKAIKQKLTAQKTKPKSAKPKARSASARQTGLKNQLKSLAFGLGLGVVVLIIFLFSFFNQIVIAPFIQPSRSHTNTPLIVNASSISPTKTPEVIIPKINVEIPVNYSLKSDNENLIEDALQNGVVHYASTVAPGQNGNVALFGHSSNNIFNPGHYKFAFVLLHTLVPGDTFYLTYNGKVYVYQVFKRIVVSPSDVGILNQSYGKQATATLITCDPPGTSINRLAVTGKQISPSLTSNTSANQKNLASKGSTKSIANNGPSLWHRIFHIF